MLQRRQALLPVVAGHRPTKAHTRECGMHECCRWYVDRSAGAIVREHERVGRDGRYGSPVCVWLGRVEPLTTDTENLLYRFVIESPRYPSAAPCIICRALSSRTSDQGYGRGVTPFSLVYLSHWHE